MERLNGTVAGVWDGETQLERVMFSCRPELCLKRSAVRFGRTVMTQGFIVCLLGFTHMSITAIVHPRNCPSQECKSTLVLIVSFGPTQE